MGREVWIISNMPPPVHGVSAFNAGLVEALSNARVPHRIFRIGTRGALATIERPTASKSLADAVSLAEFAAAAATLRKRDNVSVYFTPSLRGAAVVRDAAVARIARAARLRLFAHVHSCGWLAAWHAERGWKGRLMLDALRACERVICLGPTYAEQLHTATEIPAIGINNGARPPCTPTVRTPPLPGQRIELLFLSNLMRGKGLWTAAAAARALRDRGHLVRLRCAGAWMNEDDHAAFARDFAELLAADVVELVGFASGDQKAELFASSHLFLLPTEFPNEGQPLSLIEAMACGLVPITTDQGGINDLVNFPGSRQLANPRHRDPSAVAATCLDLMTSPRLLETISARCIEHCRAALTLETCTRSVMEVIE